MGWARIESRIRLDHAGRLMIRHWRIFVLMVAVMAVAHRVSACEPILPLAMAISGPLGFTFSLWILGIVVATKCVSFVCFARTLRWYQAVLCVVAANFLSTLIGAGVSLGLYIPDLILPSLIIVFVVSILPANMFIQWRESNRTLGAGRFKLDTMMLAFIVTSLWVGTIILFALGSGLAVEASDSRAGYWLLKVFYMFVAVSISLFLTTFWEAWAVSVIARRWASDRSFILPVLQSNIATFLIATGIGAILVLPERFRSPHFLIDYHQLENTRL